MKTAKYIKAVPYADDAMNLPVADVAAAAPFYEDTMKFRIAERNDKPVKSVTLVRDEIRMRIAENGGDPSQEGCFFEVDDVTAAFEEIHGKPPSDTDLRIDESGDTKLKVFFVVAPDGLCFMLGQVIQE